MQWTGVDARKARGEGWDYTQGYLRIVARPDGTTRYPTLVKLLETIHAKAQQNSEWHENVYMSLPWTQADDWLSEKLGFIVVRDRFHFIPNIKPYKIMCIEDLTTRANDGCLICQKALATLTRRKILHGQRQNHQ